MASTYQASLGRAGVAATIGNHSGEVIAQTSVFDLAVDGVLDTISDTIDLVRLPADHKVIGASIDTDAITALVVDIGFAEAPAANATLSNAADSLFDGQSLATAAHVVATKAGHTRLVNRSEEDQMLVATVMTAATGGTGTFRLTLLIAPVSAFTGQ